MPPHTPTSPACWFDTGHQGPRRHPKAQNFVLKTATGEDIAVHLSSSQKFWLSFLDAMDRRDLADDPRFTTYNLRADHPARTRRRGLKLGQHTRDITAEVYDQSRIGELLAAGILFAC
jgi:crotonobetainyl-CoA:carnitine CoA-transferase CaiB-like acyl-CoA transferase